MFGGDNRPSTPPNPLGVPRHRGATNQQAIPVPYAAGIVRPGVGWISDKFQVTTVAVNSQSGKGSSSVSGYNYYASIAARICEGPIDAIFAIYMNGDLVWGVEGPYTTPQLTRGAADFVDITIPTYGSCRLYWGTQTQGYDPVLATNQTLTLDDNTNPLQDDVVSIRHAPYRGTAYLVFNQLFLGFNQTNFQNIEVVFGRWPKPSWLTAPEKVGWDSNPVCVVWDLLTSPRYGLGLAESNINVDVMNATAAQLANEGIGISPYIDQEKTVREILLNIADYCGGYVYCDDNGQFALGLKRVAPDPGALIVLDETLWTARPQFDPSDFSQVITELRMTFTNIKYDLTGDYVPFRIPANRIINESMAAPQTSDRPWFTRSELVTLVAQAEGLTRGQPQRTGSVKLRRVAGLYESLTPGTQFVFNYPQRNLGNLNFRVVTRSMPDVSKPEFEITFETDLSYLYAGLALADVGEGGGGGGSHIGTGPPPEPTAFGKVIELPAGLCEDGKIAAAVLAARPGTSTIGFDVYLEKNYSGGDSYAFLASVTRFALRGLLQSALPTSTLMIDRGGFLVQFDGADVTLDEQTDFDGLNDVLLVFIGDEVLSVMGWDLVDNGLYRLYCAREQFATARENHNIGDEAYVIYRSDLVALQHKQLQIGNTATFKVAPRTANGGTDLSLVAPVDLLIGGNVFVLPPPLNLRVNGDLRPSFSDGQGITINWTLTSAGVDVPLVKMALDFFKLDGTPLGSTKTPAGCLKLQNYELLPLIGNVAQSFRLRARFETERPEGFLYSQESDLVVTKV